MADEAATRAQTVSSSRPAPELDDVIDVSTRELAQRRSGEIEVFLFWHPELDRIELCVLDSATGVSMHVDVAPDKALDAFYHPYAYMAQPKSAPGPDRPPRRTRSRLVGEGESKRI
jgi:hypothetical protein